MKWMIAEQWMLTQKITMNSRAGKSLIVSLLAKCPNAVHGAASGL